MDSEISSEPFVPEAGSSSDLVSRAAEGAGELLNQRVAALETSVHRLRLTLYFGVAVVLICGVLAGEWLFKHTVRRVDEASGAMQLQIDQRAKASRLNIEDDLSEIRRQLKAIGDAVSPASKSATSDKVAPQSEE